MSRFYVESSGQARTPASRLGSKNSGVQTHARGWHIGAKVDVQAIGDTDYVTVGITGGSADPHVKLDLGTFTLKDGVIVRAEATKTQ